MFLIHELLSEILDSQAIRAASPVPPPIQPKPQELVRERRATIDGTPPRGIQPSNVVEELQKEVRGLTLMLKQQMGFSDQSEVIKKCLNIELLTNQLPGATIKPPIAVKPLQQEKPSPIPPAAPAKPRVLIKKTSPSYRRSLSISDDLSAARGYTQPPKPSNPFATLRGDSQATRASSSGVTDLKASPFKPSAPLKPSSDFGNMSADKRRRSKTTKSKIVQGLPIT